MNKVIQLRATNAMGKTTVIRQFINKYNLIVDKINVLNDKVYVTHSKDNTLFILGKYNDKWGGCDNFKDKQQVFNTIVFLVKNYQPKYIIFEGLLYGKTFQFAYNLNNYLKRYNYKYKGIVLNSSFEFALERLKKRNNNSEINIEAFYNTWYSVLNSYKKLKQKNVDMELIDITSIKYEDMVKILEREL